MDENYGFSVPLDTYLSGWLFDKTTGELFRGFPIYESDTVLDAGCGNSPYIQFCGERGAEVIVADIDGDKVAVTVEALKATKARKISAVVGNCNPIPIEAESVDKVIALEVIEHVEAPAAFLAELARVARPGALFLISAPDAASENMQKKGLAPDEYFREPNHVRIIDRVEFTAMIEAAGLDIVDRELFGFYWTLWWTLFWACRQDLSPPWHPVLQNWTTTWSSLLDLPDGARIKRALDDTLPKTQLIIARKPG